jgi:hypothetical protein
VLSPEEVGRLLEAAPGPGLKHKAALSIARREHEEFRTAYDLAYEQRAEARNDRIDFSRSQYRYLTLWLRTTTPGQRCRMK